MLVLAAVLVTRPQAKNERNSLGARTVCMNADQRAVAAGARASLVAGRLLAHPLRSLSNDFRIAGTLGRSPQARGVRLASRLARVPFFLGPLRGSVALDGECRAFSGCGGIESKGSSSVFVTSEGRERVSRLLVTETNHDKFSSQACAQSSQCPVREVRRFDQRAGR